MSEFRSPTFPRILPILVFLASLLSVVQAATGPNVLLITSEDNGPELGCYGDTQAGTPRLDQLAREGVRFANAFITNPVCSPSRGTIFTGLYPHQNGQIGLATHRYALFRKWPNVVSLLKDAGYRTGIIGKIHVNPESAFPFDFKPDYRRMATFNHRDVKMVAAAAERFIAQDEAPFFLMVNYPDAHFPLIPQYAGVPEKPRQGAKTKPLAWVGADSPRLREFTANYYNCLSRLDVGVGLLLDVLERDQKAADTLVVYLGDHGAQFSRGKCCLYESGVRVPLIIRLPGTTRRGLVRQELASSIDLLPTILDACGVTGPENLPGRSLLPLTRGERVSDWRRHVFTESAGSTPFWTHPRRAVRGARFKLILNLLQDRPNPVHEAYLKRFNVHFAAGTTPEELAAAPAQVRGAYATWRDSPPVELYDLERDPHEWRNLAGQAEHAEIEKRLRRALEKWRNQTADPLLDPEKLQMLVNEMDGVMKSGVNYRRQKGYRWRYLEYLKPE